MEKIFVRPACKARAVEDGSARAGFACCMTPLRASLAQTPSACARKIVLDFHQRISAYARPTPETRIFGRFGGNFGYRFFGVKHNGFYLIVHGGVAYRVRDI